MEDGGNWFLYAAMIVIAFISWVFQKIQEATAARRRGQEPEDYEEERARFRDEYAEEEEALPAREEPVSRQTPPPQQPSAPAPAEEAMRKLMEALGGTVFEAPKPPEPVEVPREKPSGPPKAEESARPQLSAEERAALERVRRQEQARPVRRRVSGRLADLSIADLVRDPDGIRKAVVLREILDKPRAERPWDFS